MARIQEEVIVITISKLVKDDTADSLIIPQDVADALVSVAEELLGSGVVVEVSKA
jgi:hypothetical protein